MRILAVHNRYLIRGGEEESFEAERSLLAAHGHVIDSYEEDNRRIAPMGAARLALRTIWSRESYHAVRHQMRERGGHDVVHVQNFFPLISPAIHHAARAEGAAVVQSVRNYRLLCPNAALFREGRVCEACVGKALPWPGVAHACYRDSRLASATVAAMIAAHRALRTWQKTVDLFVALSEFARAKLIEGGVPADRVVVKPNFVRDDPGPGDGRGGFALFVGRLSAEKGLATLLAAWRQLGRELPLKIVGEGPLAPEVEAAASASGDVEWLGRRPLAEVYELMGRAKLLVFPSEWYEPFGRGIIEAFAKGTPVIAAATGAMTELVEHGRGGRLFCPGDPDDLAAQVAWTLDHPAELARMRREARAEFEAKYTAERNYRQLLAIYERAITEARARGRARSMPVRLRPAAD